MFAISNFQQLLKPLSKASFYENVDRSQSDKYFKTFHSWEHMLVMVYAQLSGINSLRNLIGSINSLPGHKYHLGIKHNISRSTLADANANRQADVFRDTALLLMNKACGTIKKTAKEVLHLIDSTPIKLVGRGFDDWTKNNHNHRTQGLKVHVLYEADQKLPLGATITAPNVNDVVEGAKLKPQRGLIYVFDKGYCDFNWWSTIDKEGAFFVTRFKQNVALKVESFLDIPTSAGDVIEEDAIVRFKNKCPRGGKQNKYITALRRVTVTRAGNRPLILATNDLDSPAEVIADRYKSRWGIEIFFKCIKQNLKIKKFMGRSENAVKIQIYCAFIAYLLVMLEKQASQYCGSLSGFFSLLAGQLFQRTKVEEKMERRRKQKLFLESFQGVLFT